MSYEDEKEFFKKHLDHIHVLKFHGNGDSILYSNLKPQGKKSYIVTELAENGDLLDWSNCVGAFPEPMARYFFKQLIAGVTHCHKSGIVHRDLKLNNMFIDKEFNVKIADFGTAKVITNEECQSPSIGTVAYSPPELYTLGPGETYDGIKFDIYSCGIILFQLLVGCVPFVNSDLTDKTNFYHTAHNQKRAFNDKFALSRDVARLFHNLIAEDPEMRPSIQEIIEDFSWMDDDENESCTKEEIAEHFHRYQLQKEQKKEV